MAVTVVGDDGVVRRIECTTGHPFWIEGKGWVAACELQAVDLLKRVDGGVFLRVASAQLTGTSADVYNFEVSGVHNYFVGLAGVLVHNDSGQPRPASFWARGLTSPEENLAHHFGKHGPEVGASNEAEYTERARTLLIGTNQVFGNVYVDAGQAGKLVLFGFTVKGPPVRGRWSSHDGRPGSRG